MGNCNKGERGETDDMAVGTARSSMTIQDPNKSINVADHTKSTISSRYESMDSAAEATTTNFFGTEIKMTVDDF